MYKNSHEKGSGWQKSLSNADTFQAVDQLLFTGNGQERRQDQEHKPGQYQNGAGKTHLRKCKNQKDLIADTQSYEERVLKKPGLFCHCLKSGINVHWLCRRPGAGTSL